MLDGLRDDETGFGPIIHSTRLSRFDYLFGRFTGAFLAGCLLFLSAPLGMILGAAMPWLDPEVLGPFNLWHYAYVYLLLCVPTLFVTGAGFFAIATATRSMMWTYVGVIVFLVLYLVATGFLSRPEFINTVALVDPFGLGAYDQATRYWTAAERNTQIPHFAGYLLWNRVLWVGVAFALLGLAWAIYSRAATGGRMTPSNVADKTNDDTPVQVSRQHGFFLLFGHGPFVEVGTLVGLEALAVGRLHQRHAELVQVIAFTALLGIKNGGAGHIEIGFVEGHDQTPCSSGQ